MLGYMSDALEYELRCGRCLVVTCKDEVAKRKCFYVCKCVCMLGCMCDAPENKLRCSKCSVVECKDEKG
jgi:hypothetical protein